jgi:ABC-type nitrate/sulfonate/bicarbonate transport system substrate-binding protein
MSANQRRFASLMAVVALVAGACSAGSTPLPTPAPSIAPGSPAGSSAASAVSPAPAPSVTPKPPSATVTLALDWTPNTNHTGFYVAQQSGWYADEAIDLQFIPYASANPETLVGAGQANCGIST